MDRPRLPGYDLLDELSSGPSTRVFLSRHRAGGFRCVVKNYIDHRSASLERLRNEARVGLAVRHPNLVRILDARVHEPPFFVVSEWVDGRSLAGCRPERARPIAGAIRALHRAGFVHNAICPESILVDPDGHATLMGLGAAGDPYAADGKTFAADWAAFAEVIGVAWAAA